MREREGEKAGIPALSPAPVWNYIKPDFFCYEDKKIKKYA